MIVGDALKGAVEKCVSGFHPSLLGYAGLDICLGDRVWREAWKAGWDRVHAMEPSLMETLYEEHKVEYAVTLAPKEFVRWQCREVFHMEPNVYAVLGLRSWAAQSGLEQNSSLVLKPGWSGNLVLELVNELRQSSLLLRPGDAVASLTFGYCDGRPSVLRNNVTPEAETFQIAGAEYTQGFLPGREA